MLWVVPGKVGHSSSPLPLDIALCGHDIGMAKATRCQEAWDQPQAHPAPLAAVKALTEEEGLGLLCSLGLCLCPHAHVCLLVPRSSLPLVAPDLLSLVTGPRGDPRSTGSGKGALPSLKALERA